VAIATIVIRNAAGAVIVRGSEFMPILDASSVGGSSATEETALDRALDETEIRDVDPEQLMLIEFVDDLVEPELPVVALCVAEEHTNLRRVAACAVLVFERVDSTQPGNKARLAKDRAEHQQPTVRKPRAGVVPCSAYCGLLPAEGSVDVLPR
jgi:hypothetical protein